MANTDSTFTPGDLVRVRAGLPGAGSIGTVTYPGQSGWPDRVYVVYRRTTGPAHLRSVTVHYHPSELEHVEPGPAAS